MKNTLFRTVGAGLLLCLPIMAVQAKEGPSVPAGQSQAFALGYTMRSCDLRAAAFTQSVKRLKEVDDDLAAGAEVAHLSDEATKIRHTQAAAYEQIARLLAKMSGPDTLQTWATQTSAMLSAPLVLSKEAQSLAKNEPGTANVMAELDELQSIKSAANAHLPALAAWLKINGGALAVWTADVGSYAADIHVASTSSGHDVLPIGAARRLLQSAPQGAPAAVRENLAGVIPKGGGNLQSLATVLPPNVSSEKMSRLLDNLLGIYVRRKPLEKPEENRVGIMPTSRPHG